MNQETLYHKNNYLIRSWRINLDLFYIDTVGSKLEKLAKPFLIDHDIQLSTPCTCLPLSRTWLKHELHDGVQIRNGSPALR